MVLRVIVPVAMILVFMCGPKTLCVARMRPTMILLIGAHITIRVANGHIADIEGYANSGVGRHGAAERRSSKSNRNCCTFQNDSHVFSFGLPERRRWNAQGALPFPARVRPAAISAPSLFAVVSLGCVPFAWAKQEAIGLR